MSTSVRLRRNKSEMYPLVQDFERLGCKLSIFCEDHSVSEHVFKYWLGRYRSEHPSEPVRGLSVFQEILATDSRTVDGIPCFVRLRDARGVEVFFEQGVSASYLKSLLSW